MLMGLLFLVLEAGTFLVFFCLQTLLIDFILQCI